MLASLANPQRIKANHRRRRRVASARQHYNYFRDYEPGTGRYAQPDPLGLESAISLYSYVGGSPLIGTDPDGLQEVVLPLPPELMVPMEESGPKPITFPLDPAQPIPQSRQQCPPKDPCKGLRDQLAAHEQKLREYMQNPYGNDNKGFLQGAPPERQQQIINGRIANLRNQIENFRRLLQKCEEEHGMI